MVYDGLESISGNEVHRLMDMTVYEVGVPHPDFAGQGEGVKVGFPDGGQVQSKHKVGI